MELIFPSGSKGGREEDGQSYTLSRAKAGTGGGAR